MFGSKNLLTNANEHSNVAASVHVLVCTVYVEHLVDIKFGDLGANTGWLTFSLVNQLSS